MDYSKMKKEDLVQLAIQNTHLAQAVSAKDHELNQLKELHATKSEHIKATLEKEYEEKLKKSIEQYRKTLDIVEADVKELTHNYEQEKSNLARAVEEKDREINRLKEKRNNEIETAVNIERDKQAAAIKKVEAERDLYLKGHEALIKEKDEQRLRDVRSVEDTFNSIVKKQEEDLEKMRGHIRFYAEKLDELLSQHGALLKVLQGVSDSHIALNDLFVKSIK